MTDTLPNNQNRTGFVPRAGKPGKTLIGIVSPLEDSRAMLRALLELWNYDVLEAETVDDLLGTSQTPHPSLILLESTLRFSDNLDDLTKIGQSEALGNIPSLFLSGFPQVAYRDAVLSRGATDFLVKPVDFDLLHEHIRTLSDGNQEANANAESS